VGDLLPLAIRFSMLDFLLHIFSWTSFQCEILFKILPMGFEILIKIDLFGKLNFHFYWYIFIVWRGSL
jgi:hypothetical protein